MRYGQVRIIGGLWRGRYLNVAEVAQLRPTTDRIRETIFSWLQPVMSGALCLDLFAGTGVLGFEALSRGAKHVVMIDNSLPAIKNLCQSRASLDAQNAEIYRAKLPTGLKKSVKPFDVVFLDPPFQSGLLSPMCEFLEKHKFLNENAHIYLESPTKITANEIPRAWRLAKSKKTGNVFYHLAIR